MLHYHQAVGAAKDQEPADGGRSADGKWVAVVVGLLGLVAGVAAVAIGNLDVNRYLAGRSARWSSG